MDEGKTVGNKTSGNNHKVFFRECYRLLNLYIVKRKQNIEQRLLLAVNPAWRTWYNSPDKVNNAEPKWYSINVMGKIKVTVICQLIHPTLTAKFLRQFSITNLLQNGLSPVQVSGISRHSDSTTLKNYQMENPQITLATSQIGFKEFAKTESLIENVTEESGATLPQPLPKPINPMAINDPDNLF